MSGDLLDDVNILLFMFDIIGKGENVFDGDNFRFLSLCSIGRGSVDGTPDKPDRLLLLPHTKSAEPSELMDNLECGLNDVALRVEEQSEFL